MTSIAQERPAPVEAVDRRDGEIIPALAHRIAAAADGAAALSAVVETAAAWVPGARWASLCRSAHGRWTTHASSGDVAQRVDAVQHRLGVGPSLAALDHLPTACVSSDLASDRRWPDLGTEASLLGVRSALATRLEVTAAERSAWVVTLYADREGAFGDEHCRARARRRLAVLGFAAAAVLDREHARHLTRALETNREIGVAMGVLMARHRITRDQAFDLLRLASQNGNRKLRDIAVEVADTGELQFPARGLRRP